MEILDAEGQRVLTVMVFGLILIFVRLLWPDKEQKCLDKEQKRLKEKLDLLIQKKRGGSYSSKPVTVNEILAERLTEED